jgi:hypothetical protein
MNKIKYTLPRAQNATRFEPPFAMVLLWLRSFVVVVVIVVVVVVLVIVVAVVVVIIVVFVPQLRDRL